MKPTAKRAGRRPRQRRLREAVRTGRRPDRPRRSPSGTSRSKSSASSPARAGPQRARSATTSSTRSTCRSTTVHRLLNLTKLNTITVTAQSAAETTRVSKDVTRCCAQRHSIGEASPTTSSSRTQARAALGKGHEPAGRAGDRRQRARARSGDARAAVDHPRAIEPHDDGAARRASPACRCSSAASAS